MIARALSRQGTIIVIAIVVLAGLAWLWTVSGAGLSSSMGALERSSAHMGADAPGHASLLLLVAMWWVMMIAMMLPSAAPAILLYDRVRSANRGAAGIASAGLFLTGYLLAWLGFSLIATGLQVVGTLTAWIDPMSLAAGTARAHGILLLVVGIYQLTPIKDACLTQCRAPAAFLSRYWRPGHAGALRLGVLHGAYCVGCCWMLMMLLFVGGIMNMAWVAGLAVLVAAEKLLPFGKWIARGSGAAMVAWAGAILLS